MELPWHSLLVYISYTICRPCLTELSSSLAEARVPEVYIMEAGNTCSITHLCIAAARLQGKLLSGTKDYAFLANLPSACDYIILLYKCTKALQGSTSNSNLNIYLDNIIMHGLEAV